MSRSRGLLEAAALVAAVVGLCAVVGVSNPLPVAGVSTDSLGPDSGETVAEYVARSREGLAEQADAEDHWALVSFETYISAGRSFDLLRGERIAQVLIRVPIERVQTRVLTVGVPGTEASVLESSAFAATQLSSGVGQWDRQSQIDAASVARLTAGCDCVVGLVVRATPAALADVADSEGVRAVEVLPADARAGHFAVRALLPDYVETIGPLPDDGPVPPA